VEGVQLVRSWLQSQNQVVCEELDNVLVERLVLLVAAVRFDENVLEAVLWAIFGIDYEIPEELVHVGFENVPEVHRVVDLREN